MMWPKKKYVVLIALLCLLNISLLFMYGSERGTMKSVLQKNISSAAQNEALKAQLESNLRIIKEFNFDPDQILLNEQGKEIPIKKVLNGESKLVFRFSDDECSSCYEQEFKNLKSINLNKSDVIVLAKLTSINALQILKKNLKIPFLIYSLNTINSSNNINQDLHIPFYFVLDTNLISKFLFIPHRDFENFSKDYYRSIESYFNMINKSKLGTASFDTRIIEMGKIRSGKKYNVTFTVKNNMKIPLLINDISTSCGCTVAEWDKSPIRSGINTKIQVIYNAEYPGKFTKEVIVKTNSSNEYTKLLIMGQVY